MDTNLGNLLNIRKKQSLAADADKIRRLQV